MLNLGHILAALTDYQPTGKEPAVASVVVDSREAGPGSLFVALPGEHVDGHDYVADAFARGAVAALVDRPVGDSATPSWPVIDTTAPLDLASLSPWGRAGERGRERAGQRFARKAAPRPVVIQVDNTLRALQAVARVWRARFNVRVIGITGSVGKTSTKELTAAILSRRFNTLKSTGNQNNEIGVPLTLLNLRPEHERAVIEMGMYAQGEIDLLCDLARPEIGVVTMIGPVHLERLGSLEAIVAAKRELVAALPESGTAVLNLDDARVMSMASHTKARIFTYGLDQGADLWADRIESMGLDGVRFTLHHAGESLSVRVPLLGRHSVHTALRATAVGLIEGLSWEEIVAGLNAMASQLRLVVSDGPRGSVIIDDTYNSSPDSALAALNLLADLQGRRIAVLGDMLELGRAEKQAHRVVGRRAADVADVVITVGARARTIADEALALGLPVERVLSVDDAPEATPLLRELIQAGDVVLVKGSLGMRMDRIVSALGELD
ncbi:UDP-N-acetylmuramoyl-tripeptide--D-alanyl-D-alanine ligase [Promineifilum sp.]|uniref:UDP-N-acetylmuramoyl-tripeptide--D-alanyl-D- alanine ligase n=1 Tax=Promineifilum sp. TaxID=2664178 RepID=UPI0035AF0EC1